VAGRCAELIVACGTDAGSPESTPVAAVIILRSLMMSVENKERRKQLAKRCAAGMIVRAALLSWEAGAVFRGLGAWQKTTQQQF
jgi:hypothetical protein